MSDTGSIFSCRPTDGCAESNHRKRASPDAISIDIHCHAHVDAADALVAPYRETGQEPILDHASVATIAQNRASLGAVKEKLSALDRRLPDMDLQGIDLQVISPSPFQYFYWAEPELARETSRCVNDWIAERVNHRSGRFAGMCTVPLQHTAYAIEELERAILTLGLKGVEIGTVVGTEELSAERLRPFFSKAQELDVFIFIHPNGFSDGRRLAEHNLINLIGNPLETTIAASRMILGGTLKNFPTLKICLAHGGGYLPMYSGRMDHAYEVRPDCRAHIDRPPSEFLRKFYFDSVVYQPTQLQYLVTVFGADRVLLGTDYPYDMGEPDPLGLIARAPGLNDSERAAIIGGNAMRLLGLDARRVGRAEI